MCSEAASCAARWRWWAGICMAALSANDNGPYIQTNTERSAADGATRVRGRAKGVVEHALVLLHALRVAVLHQVQRHLVWPSSRGRTRGRGAADTHSRGLEQVPNGSDLNERPPCQTRAGAWAAAGARPRRVSPSASPPLAGPTGGRRARAPRECGRSVPVTRSAHGPQIEKIAPRPGSMEFVLGFVINSAVLEKQAHRFT